MFYFNQQVHFRVNTKEYQLQLTPDVREGNRYQVEDKTIELQMIPNDEFERVGDDLIHHIKFSDEYAGMRSKVDLTLIDGQQYSPVVDLIDGNIYHIPHFGFLKTDGTRGNCIFVIHLILL